MRTTSRVTRTTEKEKKKGRGGSPDDKKEDHWIRHVSHFLLRSLRTIKPHTRRGGQITKRGKCGGTAHDAYEFEG